MPVAANIVIADGQATPVNHTLIPLGRDEGGVLRYIEQTTGPVLGAWTAGFSMRKPGPAKPGTNTASRIEQHKITARVPVLETLANNAAGYVPSPMVAYFNESSLVFNIPERANSVERLTIQKVLLGLAGSAVATDMVTKGILQQ
jgi:hypothetical protein